MKDVIKRQPPEGGYRQPSHIMRDYAHSALRTECAACGPHNLHYVKWPGRCAP